VRAGNGRLIYSTGINAISGWGDVSV
jgi:hypothetical protein